MALDRRSHLHQLESESITVMREVAAQFERPVLLFSGGKDSILMVRLAEKAFVVSGWRSYRVPPGHGDPEEACLNDVPIQNAPCAVKPVVISLPSATLQKKPCSDDERQANDYGCDLLHLVQPTS